MGRTVKVFLLLGLVMGLASALFMYWGSAQVPWEMQTWNGSSSAEKAFHLARQKETTIGFVLLFCAFLLQLFGTFWEDATQIWKKFHLLIKLRHR